MLTGLLGFPWPDASIEARCMALDPAGVSSRERGRYHRAVPALGCTCGIYAVTDGFDTTIMPRSPFAEPTVEGFVRLTGRLIVREPEVRAEKAEIAGPLVLRPGRRPWWIPETWEPARLSVERNRYRIRWQRGSAASNLLDDLAAGLSDRYRTGVIVS